MFKNNLNLKRTFYMTKKTASKVVHDIRSPVFTIRDISGTLLEMAREKEQIDEQFYNGVNKVYELAEILTQYIETQESELKKSDDEST